MNPFRRRLLLVLAAVAALPARAEPVAWNAWSDAVFARARREHRFVLLDLEAGWCHWCHVMAATTYADPQVQGLLSADYLAVKADQDARPDLAARYEDFGWPATIIYAPDGTEIVKKQGYIEPAAMVRLLRAVIADPSPVDYGDKGALGLSPAASSRPTQAREAALRRQWRDGYDAKGGGWGVEHKFLDWDNVEYAMRLALRGDAEAERMARETVRLQRQLLDPVWGGMYQYSVGGGWNEPHFEKIMPMQAENLRLCALAYAQWGDPEDLRTARSIHRYLRDFLRGPDGAFYTSQDADLVPGRESAGYFALDDAGRRRQGVPRIDRHIYARENGWAVAGLAEFSAVTGDAEARAEAETAARWIVDHRGLAGGGYRHDEVDAAGPYLGDTLAMGRAFLALYELTADSAWLDRAQAAAGFIGRHFGRGSEAGFASADTSRPAFPPPRPEFDENVGVARFGTALTEATGRPEGEALAESALRWLLAPGVAQARHFYVGGLLLALDDNGSDPLHIAIVGRRDDPVAAALHAAALRAPTAHRLIEWWDRRLGPAPRGEDIYPDLPRAAAYLCAGGACSSPLGDPAALAARIAKALKP